jgi:hypothetical protein
MSKKILILTGPQGAGNHLWSKIFSLHPAVFGWKSLLENYWEAHRIAEPFAAYWRDPSLLQGFDWDLSEYYFTSISIPLGIKETRWAPNLNLFIDNLIKLGIDVEVVVCGREKNILGHQQTRLRQEVTTPLLLSAIDNLDVELKFVSYELLHLYQKRYLKTLKFNIPVAWNDARIENFLEEDSNIKYIHHVDDHFLDECNRTGRTLKTRP